MESGANSSPLWGWIGPGCMSYQGYTHTYFIKWIAKQKANSRKKIPTIHNNKEILSPRLSKQSM